MDQPNYRVLLEGRMVGPYDRKTILGMRIKQTLSSDDLLVGSDGTQLTVRELVRQEQPARFQPGRTGGFSKVQATYAARLIETEGPAPGIPPFSGELEARVQGDVLRLAGRHRRLLRWKEDRCKIALDEVTNSRVAGSRVDLWLRAAPSAARPRIALELFTPEAAAALVGWLPLAEPMPDPPPRPPAVAAAPASSAQVLGIAVTGIALVIGVMLLVLLLRRVY